jgi:nitrogen fixation/metabolism regulation signal transduction histidine kinase
MDFALELMQQLIENLNVGIVVLNKDNQILIFNKKAGEFLQQDAKSHQSFGAILRELNQDYLR